eukprot:CAMPEP_0203785618 /NCGR_PEP_ID=MMETSP0100_2-20121128/1133_1 /ASSEMBLY_ACC=CAM_ASM_000210 /TAXON_ID=96639 /ORGANISM=" , Strain NY0313808BC1" /LENGTH=169 /DNA_ID=CAMNT_0050687753 /DNA_START=68 /DNA_END=574 /DNA_ORIENTATION=-
MPDQAIKHGTVELCLSDLESVNLTAPSGQALKELPDNLRCLHTLTLNPIGRKPAIAFGGVKALLELMQAETIPKEIKGPCSACLTNLLEDPAHVSKCDALDFGAPEILHPLLFASITLSKPALDQVLYTLQAIAVLCTHARARERFRDGLDVQIRKLSKSSLDIVSRTA